MVDRYKGWKSKATRAENLVNASYLPTNGIFAVGLGRDMLSRIDKTREVLGPLASRHNKNIAFISGEECFGPIPQLSLHKMKVG